MIAMSRVLYPLIAAGAGCGWATTCSHPHLGVRMPLGTINMDYELARRGRLHGRARFLDILYCEYRCCLLLQLLCSSCGSHCSCLESMFVSSVAFPVTHCSTAQAPA